jgi:hypothetical protein
MPYKKIKQLIFFRHADKPVNPLKNCSNKAIKHLALYNLNGQQTFK